MSPHAHSDPLVPHLKQHPLSHSTTPIVDLAVYTPRPSTVECKLMVTCPLVLNSAWCLIS